MKVKRSYRVPDAPESSRRMEKSAQNGVEKDRSKQRRKSGAFRGMSLRGLFTSEPTDSTPGTVVETADDKPSMMKRFGVRRSSKKKAKKSSGSSDGNMEDAMSRSLIDSDTLTRDHNRKTKEAGNTPKLQKLEGASAAKVYKMLERTPWGSDDSDSEQTFTTRIKRRSSLREAGRKLKRSMSMICGGSRSRIVQDHVEASTTLSLRDRSHRSVGVGLVNVIEQMSVKGPVELASGQAEISVMESQEQKENDDVQGPSQDFNTTKAANTPKNSDTCKKNGYSLSARKKIELRCQSDGSLALSARKWRLKRQSYERMNYERDFCSPKPNSVKPGDANIALPKRTLPLKLESPNLEPKSEKTSPQRDLQTTVPAGKPFVSRKESLRRSLRRKSVGILSSPLDRRSSGVYAPANTPTFMTCGYIMTDSPPDGDLASVTMKRKRRSEGAQCSRVNRCNAGHTPLPPRKKRCSYGERLIE